MSIQEHVNQVKANIAAAAQAAGRDPEEITLCAATKVQTDDTIRAAIRRRDHRVRREPGAGAHRPPGGGRLPGGPGPLHRPFADQQGEAGVGKVDLIHSVDSERLLRAIDAQAAKQDLVQDILLRGQHRRRGEQGGLHPGGGPSAGPADPGAGARPPAGPDGNSTHLPGTWGQPPVFCRYATAFC